MSDSLYTICLATRGADPCAPVELLISRHWFDNDYDYDYDYEIDYEHEHEHEETPTMTAIMKSWPPAQLDAFALQHPRTSLDPLY
jgi:hypothetical protein